MKRILFASWYSGLGGGETDLLFLAESLDPRRFECHLVLPNEGQLSERWRAKGWHAHIVPFRGASTLFVPAIWARFPIVDRFATLLKQKSIDIVHSDYHTLPMMAAAAGRAGVPILFTLWGWWFKPKSWQRKFLQDIPAIVARSKAIRDGFLGSPPFMPADTIPVIYSGVDIKRFNPDIDGKYLRDEIGIPGDCPVIAMVARFQRVKGHHTFQALAETIAAQMPQAHFVVAGDDVFGVTADARYRDQILQAAADNALLRDRLHYIGFRHDVEGVYAAADVVVCPSAFESFGRANLEAMACGKPVVSTKHGGPAETILHGETGILVEPTDTRALAEGVLQLLNDGDLRSRMGAAGRAHVCQVFSNAATTVAYQDIFERLLTLN